MDKNKKIYIAGHSGLVGSALLSKLEDEGYPNIIARTHSELNLERQEETEAFFKLERPEYVFLAAAKVGGIWASNNYPAEFIYKNLAIQTNVIHASWKYGVDRLLFLGSSCVYPRECPQPMNEKHLLTAPLEPTNEPYSLAKISGIKMCQAYNRQHGTNFISVMPTNLYGPNDNYDPKTSHVLPALIRKFHEAKTQEASQQLAKDSTPVQPPSPPPLEDKNSVIIWGTGSQRREFLHVDDLADACFFLMNLPDKAFQSLLNDQQAPLLNIGWGKDISIREIALLIKDIVGFQGEIAFDHTKPDGTPRKLLDISRLKNLGWVPKIRLKTGIELTYNWCLDNSIF